MSQPQGKVLAECTVDTPYARETFRVELILLATPDVYTVLHDDGTRGEFYVVEEFAETRGRVMSKMPGCRWAACRASSAEAAARACMAQLVSEAQAQAVADE